MVREGSFAVAGATEEMEKNFSSVQQEQLEKLC